MEYIDEFGKSGEVLARYVKGRLLGKGGFAKCYEATHIETKEKFAVKVISKSTLSKPKTRQKLKTEIKIHRSIDHRHVVRFVKYFEDSRHVYILMELCRGQTLMEQSSRKGRFTEEETSYLLYQCLLALRHMHAQGVIHRDLKLGNIMLTHDNEVKVGDFGLAAKVDHMGDKRRTLCGTPNYIAPEILQAGHVHSFEVDVWTIGIIMYAMLCGKPPFQTSDVKTTYGRIKRCSYTFPPHVNISREARSMIGRILQVAPDSRPTVSELLEDPWFSLHKPRRLAPLSLFTPGSATYHTQQLKHAEERRSGGGGVEVPNTVHLPAGRDVPVGKPAREPLGRIDGNAPAGREKAPAYADGVRGMRTHSAAGAGAGRGDPSSAAAGSPRAGRSSSVAYKPLSSYAAQRGVGVGSKAPLPQHSPTSWGRYAAPSRSASTAGSPLRLYNSSPAVPAESPQPVHLRSSSPSGSHSPVERLRNIRRSPSAASGRLHGSRVPSPAPCHHHLRPRRSCSTASATRARGSLPSSRSMSPSPTAPASAASVPRSSSPSPATAAAERDTASSDAPQPTPPSASPPQHELPCHEAAEPAAPASVPAPGANVEDDDKNLTRLHTRLEETLALQGGEKAYGEAPVPPAHNGPHLWVTECADFTNDYGLAYRLSNGQIAVHFNDNTKMVHSVDTGVIWYVDRIRGASRDRAVPSRESISQHHVSSYPESLNKKVTLIKYFATYINRFKGRAPKQGQQEVVSCSCADTAASSGVSNPGTEGLVYVRKWLRTHEATIFRLSNKTVQVCFSDKTEVILSSEAKLVTYTDRSGSRSTFSLNAMSYTEPEVANRLRHTKEIIGQLIHVNRRG